MTEVMDGINVLHQDTIQGEMETMDTIIDQKIRTVKVIIRDGSTDGIQMVVNVDLVIIIENGKKPVVVGIKIIVSGKTILSILRTNMVLLTKT